MQHPASLEMDNLRLRVSAYRSEYARGPQQWPYRCCELALNALETGNYGVGAVLLDAAGELLVEAENSVFSPGFSSSAHAEMKLLDQFETQFPNYPDRSELTLYVSLEPCPMCCVRILAAGIGRVIYLAGDKNGGMMSRCSKLPDAWVNLSRLVEIKEFQGERELKTLAADLAAAQLPSLRRKLMAIIRPNS